MLEEEREKLYNEIRNIGQMKIEKGKTELALACEKIMKELKEMNPFRLLISSYGFESPIMAEKYKKAISGDLEEKECLVIPYASKNPEKAFEGIKKHLIDFGFSENNILMVNDPMDLFLSFPDFIYVSGGDPFLLLKALKSLNLSEHVIDCVKEKRSTYIGVSAGADILAKSIEYVTLFEDNNHLHDGDFSALSLIDEGILCHYDRRSFSLLKECSKISGSDFLTLKDDQLIEITDGKWEYIGDEL